MNYFATEEEIRGKTVTASIDEAIRILNKTGNAEAAQSLCPAGGPVVRCNANGTVQVIDDDTHSVTFASTGRGKTRRFVYPTVFSDILSGTNIVVNDMKGEIYATSRDLLALMGYTTYVLDLREPAKSPSRYNPMSIAWDEWQAGNADGAFFYLRNLALSIFDKLSSNTDDAFWTSTATDYFMGLALGMLEAGVSREAFTLESVARMDRDGSGKAHGYGGDTQLKDFFKRLPKDSLAAQNASGTYDAPNDTRASILSVFRSPMALYSGQQGLMDALCRSDFDAVELTQPKRALFVISPDETHSFGPVVIGILNQVMSSMISLAQKQHGGVLPNRVDFILDEMGNLPARIPDIEALVSASRSRNMRFHFVLQSAAQLENVYGKQVKDVILDNCDTWLYMGSRGLGFLKEISALAGTVQLASGEKRPLFSVEKLQRLETRDTETETLVFVSSLKPYVAALRDIGQYATPAEQPHDAHQKRVIPHEVFDLEACVKRLEEERVERARQELRRQGEMEEAAQAEVDRRRGTLVERMQAEHERRERELEERANEEYERTKKQIEELRRLLRDNQPSLDDIGSGEGSGSDGEGSGDGEDSGSDGEDW